MAIRVEALFTGEAFVPTSGTGLEPNRRYWLTVSTEPAVGEEPADAWDALESLAGSVSGPRDWSEEHDHYTSGASKHGDEGPSAVCP